ncbi:MAG: hypothetical protein WC415_03110 [Patescibacteria group bacterium]
MDNWNVVEAEGRARDEHNPLLFYMVLVARPTRSRNGMTTLLAFKFVWERAEEIIILDVPVFSGLFKIIICGARDFPYYLVARTLFLEFTAISFGLEATSGKDERSCVSFRVFLTIHRDAAAASEGAPVIRGGRVRQRK